MFSRYLYSKIMSSHETDVLLLANDNDLKILDNLQIHYIKKELDITQLDKNYSMAMYHTIVNKNEFEQKYREHSVLRQKNSA